MNSFLLHHQVSSRQAVPAKHVLNPEGRTSQVSDNLAQNSSNLLQYHKHRTDSGSKTEIYHQMKTTAFSISQQADIPE
jgi:hypothetical protein